MNLVQLFIQNQTKPRSFRVEKSRVENAESEATIYLYDVIGGDWFGGINAKDFAAELAGITADVIHLRINSPGGDVFEGRAIATALQQHKAKVIAHVDGLAASSASWVALAADEVEIAEGAFFMIHNAWTLAMGDKSDMLDTAALLEKIDATFVADYAKRTGQSEEQLRAWMDAETWFTAAKSVEYGMADRIAEPAKKTSNTWNLTAYKNAPKIEAPETPETNSQPAFDRAAAERRLQLLDLSGRNTIAA